MIEITKGRLSQGFDLLRVAENCPSFHNCLWLPRPFLPRLIDALSKSCPCGDCKIISFRKTLEEDSPALYAETLRLSRFADMSKLAANMKKPVVSDKMARKIRRRSHDLRIFGKLIILALYPLFLETNEIPFLMPVEIRELEKNYGESEIRQTVLRMGEINTNWAGWIESIIEDLLSAYENYPWATIYLIYLFLKGIEKNQLPDLSNMTRKEKDKFFLEMKTLFNK